MKCKCAPVQQRSQRHLEENGHTPSALLTSLFSQPLNNVYQFKGGGVIIPPVSPGPGNIHGKLARQEANPHKSSLNCLHLVCEKQHADLEQGAQCNRPKAISQPRLFTWSQGMGVRDRARHFTQKKKRKVCTFGKRLYSSSAHRVVTPPPPAPPRSQPSS